MSRTARQQAEEQSRQTLLRYRHRSDQIEAGVRDMITNAQPHLEALRQAVNSGSHLERCAFLISLRASDQVLLDHEDIDLRSFMYGYITRCLDAEPEGGAT